MSGRTDQDGLPPERPSTFNREKADLNALLYGKGVSLSQQGWDQLYGWLDDTITRHRGQAYASGVEAGRRQDRVGRVDWSELFPYIPLVLVVLLLVLGVL